MVIKVLEIRAAGNHMIKKYHEYQGYHKYHELGF